MKQGQICKHLAGFVKFEANQNKWHYFSTLVEFEEVS
jgi:hypothetical protein